MKTCLLILVLLGGLSYSSLAQTVLTDRDKASVKIWLKGDLHKHQYDWKETDTSYTVTTHDNFRPIEVHCSFDKPDKNGKCIAEKLSFDCDSCYEKIFKLMLDKKRFHWKLVGADRYLSKASRHLLLAGNAEKHYLTLTILDVKGDEYKKLVKDIDPNSTN